MMTTTPGADDLDTAVRRFVYQWFLDHQVPPSAEKTAAGLGIPEPAVLAAYRRLHAAHVLVLAGDGATIRMAMPFSAVSTPFRVTAGGASWWANCAWDALGIPAMLGADAAIETSCADCGEPLPLTVRDGRLTVTPAVVHFAVPPARFWEDIAFT